MQSTGQRLPKTPYRCKMLCVSIHPPSFLSLLQPPSFWSWVKALCLPRSLSNFVSVFNGNVKRLQFKCDTLGATSCVLFSHSAENQTTWIAPRCFLSSSWDIDGGGELSQRVKIGTQEVLLVDPAGVFSAAMPAGVTPCKCTQSSGGESRQRWLSFQSLNSQCSHFFLLLVLHCLLSAKDSLF